MDVAGVVVASTGLTEWIGDGMVLGWRHAQG